ncbi:MAG: alpha-amylase family glycosyl hydrolase, partial [Candidatus Neomarinimicrobiota bacterium]
QLILLDLDRDGIYEVTTYLNPKKHEYKLIVDGKWINDPANPDSVSNNMGGFNSVLDLRETDAVPTGFFIRTGHSGRQFTFRFQRPPGAAAVNPRSITVLVNNYKLPAHQWKFKSGAEELMLAFHIKTKGFVRILAQDEAGRVCRETQFLLEHGQTITASTPLDSWYTQVVYFPITDRFYDGNPFNNWASPDPALEPLANYCGGDLEGITQKIEQGYFDSLGVSTLWLSPLNRGPDSAYEEYPPPHRKYTGYHGYWPVHPTQVEHRIGGRGAARELVTTAHDYHLRAILDFVANHTHEKHPYFQDHRDWYGHLELPDGRRNIRLWDEQRLTTWFDTFLPSFDYLHSREALETMTDNALWWIETFELDGFRHDAVKHLPGQFWITLTRKLHERFPDRHLYQLGETYGSDALIKSYVNSAQLDGQFNFDLYFNTREAFALGTGSMTDIAWTLKRNLAVYDPLNLMGTLVSSHDQVRFISLADRKVSFTENAQEAAWTHPPSPAGSPAHERLRLYCTFVLTVPGVPVIYYGDEIGMAGAGDPDNRRPMKWTGWIDDEQATFNAVSKLLHLRRQHPALAVGDLVVEAATEHLLAYRRIGFEEEFLVVLNKGEKDQSFRLPGEELEWTAVYGGKGRFKGGGEVTVPIRSGVIWRRVETTMDER